MASKNRANQPGTPPLSKKQCKDQVGEKSVNEDEADGTHEQSSQKGNESSRTAEDSQENKALESSVENEDEDEYEDSESIVENEDEDEDENSGSSVEDDDGRTIAQRVLDRRHDQNFLLVVPELKKRYGIDVGEELGRGSYGRVYSAVQSMKNKKTEKKEQKAIAVKMQQPSKSAQEEIDKMETLDHQNIIQYFGSHVTKDMSVIFMEEADQSLWDNLKGKPMDETLAKKLFSGILAGMTYLHEEKKLAHHDIKLHNIMLKNGVVKIVDFGAAEYFDGKGLSRNWEGTPVYFSPEVMRHDPFNPVKKDIWALGCVLYSLLTGTHPFEFGCDPRQYSKGSLLYENVTKGKRSSKFKGKLSANAVNLINRMLEVNPGKRISLGEVDEHPWMKS